MTPFSSNRFHQRQWVDLDLPVIENSLTTGSIAVIDELDAAIHLMLLPEIISWSYDPVRNRNGAQLWMSCHNVSLLEYLSPPLPLRIASPGLLPRPGGAKDRAATIRVPPAPGFRRGPAMERLLSLRKRG